MKIIRSTVATLTISLFIFAPSAQADTQAIIDKIIEAYGGEDTWHAAKGFSQQGHTYSQHRDLQGQTTRMYRHPGSMRIDIRYSAEDTELRQLDGEQAWNHGEPGTHPYMLATRLQAYRLSLPLQLIDHRNEVKDLGQRNDDKGNPHAGLMLEYDQGLQIIMDVDLNSGHILGSWGLMEMMGQHMEFATLYEDFRKVDGRLVAFKENHYAMGSYIGFTTLDKVTFVDEFPPHSFAP